MYFSNKYNSSNWLLISLVLLNNFWSFSYLNLKIYQYIHLCILLYFIFTITKSSNIPTQKPHLYKKWIKAMIILPLGSVFSCYYLNNQDILLSMIIYRMHLGWLLYFVLHKKNTTFEECTKTIYYIAIGYAIISIIQQFTYPFAPFGERTVGSAYSERFFSEGVERRFGLYRFSVYGVYYAVLLLFLSLRKKIIISKAFSFILFIGIAAYGSRQIIAYTLLGVFIILANQKGKLKLLSVLCYTTIIFIVFNSLRTSEQELMDVSSSLEEGRLHSYIYYYNEFTHNIISMIFGHGLPHASSEYGKTIPVFMNKVVTFSDVGVLGSAYLFGGIYVVIYLILMIKFLIHKNLDLGLKCMALFFILLSPISSPLWEIKGMTFQALFIYICELNIQQNKLTTNKI